MVCYYRVCFFIVINCFTEYLHSVFNVVYSSMFLVMQIKYIVTLAVVQGLCFPSEGKSCRKPISLI